MKRTGGCRDKCTEYAAVAHLVERHLAKVEVASSSLVGRSNGVVVITPYMVTWPSGKARVCKTLIHQFKSGRHLQKIPGSFGFRDFLFLSSLILEKHSSAHFCGIAGGFARWQLRLHGGHPCAVQMHPVMVSAATSGRCRAPRRWTMCC